MYLCVCVFVCYPVRGELLGCLLANGRGTCPTPQWHIVFISDCGLGVEASVLLTVFTVHHLSQPPPLFFCGGPEGAGVWVLEKREKEVGVDEVQVIQRDVTWKDIP